MNDSQKQSPGAVDFTALVEEARGGDQEAFTALYEASCQEVYRTIRAMVRSEELALDIQQDAYVYAFSRLDQLEDPAKFRSWLRSIAVNCTHTALRRQTPVLFTELEDDEGAGIPERADLRPEASPELSLERKEAAAYVREILDGLTPGQRMLVSMYYYEQLPVGRIAEDLGVSSGTVKTQLFRGRKKIEAAVKRLEAKGVKLFGLSPLPFLLALLKGLEPAAAAEKRVLNGALNRAGLAPAAEAVSVHVGRSFFQTALGRVVLGLIAAGVIGGGIAGYSWARDNILIGDVRTPTSVETAEDLTTEPVTRNDSEEDLFPEPSTAPTEPTEITTEPIEITTEAPEITTEPSEPPTEPDPGTQPTQPTPTEPPPTEPQPTETEPSEAPESFFSWAWDTGGQMDWKVSADENGFGESRTLTVALSASDSPELYAEDEEVVRITRSPYYSALSDKTGISEPGVWITRKQWEITPVANGVTRIHCAVNGRVVSTLTVTVTTPVKLLDSRVVDMPPYYAHTEESMGNCVVGMEYELYAKVLGAEAPVFRTDNESVARLEAVTWEQAGPTTGRSCVKLQIVGAGDAHVSLSLNGRTEKTWTIHASAEAVDQSDSEEDLIPPDTEPG